jgi:plastocyanin
MKTLLNIVVAFVLSALLCLAHAQAQVQTVSGSTVSGEIRLVEEKSGKLVRDSSGVAVWLVPLGAVEPARLNANKQAYRMVQHNKQFHPHLLVVPLGSVVRFPNLDPWFHNVFSLYRGKRFDLGLYETGSEKAVKFDRLGPSYIFCNIHPQMMAVVLTVDTTFYSVSDKTGHWSIAGVPAGRYALHVWDENAVPSALRALERDIVVGLDGAVLTQLTVPVTPRNWLQHPNLYGGQYDPKQLNPVY